MSPREDDDRVCDGTKPLSLPPSIDSPRLARRRVARFVAEEHLNGATDALSLIVTELVNNAVMYGREPIGLSLTLCDGTVHVEVTDGDRDIGAVRFRDVDRPVIGGRGLRIVAALAEGWGIEPTMVGKSVWVDYRPANG